MLALAALIRGRGVVPDGGGGGLIALTRGVLHGIGDIISDRSVVNVDSGTDRIWLRERRDGEFPNDLLAITDSARGPYCNTNCASRTLMDYQTMETDREAAVIWFRETADRCDDAFWNGVMRALSDGIVTTEW